MRDALTWWELLINPEYPEVIEEKSDEIEGKAH
jgi:hypothetical protein